MRFVLASASPARLATLQRAGIRPEVIVSGVDEDAVHAATTAELVAALAEAKAQAVAGRIGGPALVLGCDSLLDFAGQGLGKPGSQAAAAERWRLMRGRSATLHTGHHLIDVAAARAVTRSVATTVHFADVSDAEIELYCGTDEPTRVAGAFTLDGLGGWFVEGIAGDPHNVVGVSLPAVRAMLADLGHPLEAVGYPVT